MPDPVQIRRAAPYLLMLLLGAIEPATHVWIQHFPPAGTAPSGLHTGDSGHHLAALESIATGFHSPFVTCKAEDSGTGPRYFAAPIFLLYAVAGAFGSAAGLAPFLWLGVLNGLGGMLLLWSVYRFMRRIAPQEADRAFYIYALGGGLGGAVFLGCWLAGGVAAPGFEAWFHRFARYELIEGQYLSPILLMPRFYYTFPLALGFAALTALVETDWCRCPGHLFFTCFLLFITACVNLRIGPLIWAAGAGYLLLASRNDARYRASLAAATLAATAAGSAVFLWAMGQHPSYAENVGAVTRDCMLLVPFVYATLFHWPAVCTAAWRLASCLSRPVRAGLAGACGYLAAYALLYLGHQAWYGNWWRGGDLQAALFASDLALAAAIPLAVAGWCWTPRPASGAAASPVARWILIWFVVLLVVSLSAWGQGWFLRFSPQRGMVLLGVPLALLAAAGLRQMPVRAGRVCFALILIGGVLSQAVAALYFQGPLGRIPGKGPFAYLHYEHITEADARLLALLPEGTVAAPPWSPIAFGEVIARHGNHQVLGGPGALNLGDQPFGPLQEAINRFFSPDASEEYRHAFAREYCLEYVYCPDTCVLDDSVMTQFLAIPWMVPIARDGEGAIFSVNAPR